MNIGTCISLYSMEMATMLPSERDGKSKRAKREEDDQDLISALPIHLLQHILSLIPTRDAVRISTLSRTLLHAWNSILFYTFRFASYATRLVDALPSLARFYSAVSVLREKEATMFVNLHVSWPYFRSDLYEDCIRDWMRVAARHRVRELEIDVLPEKAEEETMETCALSREAMFAVSESLVVLRLRGCRMPIRSLRIKNRELVSLRVLFWEDNFLDGQAVEEFLPLCPLLEECTLVAVSKRASSLALSGHRKLRKVKIDGFLRVIIQDMPSFQVLDISNFLFALCLCEVIHE